MKKCDLEEVHHNNYRYVTYSQIYDVDMQMKETLDLLVLYLFSQIQYMKRKWTSSVFYIEENTM